MLSWANGPVASRLWDFDYFNGAFIKRRNFILEEILYHITFLRANSSFTWLFQEAGVTGAGEFGASSGFALLPPKPRWKQ